MTGGPRVLVVRNDRTDPPALLGEWLRSAGLELVEVHADAGQPVPTAVPVGIDAVIVLGGSMSATDDDVAPWLPTVRELLRDAVNGGVPTLGVCLGGQLMTVALGGVVLPAATPEVGVTELRLTPDAVADDLFADLPQGAPVSQYHEDEMVTLPEGAVVLAATPHCRHQAWRLGSSAWAVQFHPEVDAAVVASWTRDDPEMLGLSGRDADEVVAEVAARGAEMVEAWSRFATRFADVVRVGASRVGPS